MNENIKKDTTPIDICICTFKRPHIADTMRSVSRLQLRDNWKIRVIVADNDETPSARELVQKIAAEKGLNVTYVHAPFANISVARNACLDAATAPLMAFVDDDEEVTEGWLVAMMSCLESSGADVVLGPVCAVYEPTAPAWMRQGDFHSCSAVYNNKKILSGYSGNVIMKRQSLAVNRLRFRMELGKSGGEDTVFFATVSNRGGILAYSPDAVITEKVPPVRATIHWLLKRALRSGHTHGLLAFEHAGGNVSGNIKIMVKSTAKIIFCILGIVASIPKRDRMAYWLLRAALHAGVISAVLGAKGLPHE